MAEQDNDDEIDDLVDTKLVKSVKLIGSEEYVDAAQSIQSDPYDHESWLVLVEEVISGRGGSATVRDTYDRFLQHFPVSAKVWGDLATWYEKQGDDKTAEDILDGCVERVRSVQLWQQYMRIASRPSAHSSSSSSLGPDSNEIRRKTELLFERVVLNVGMSHDSAPVWRAYIDFVKEWPGAAGMDPEKKLAALRLVYQRALTVPTPSTEAFWEEYSTYERAQGEFTAGEVLPEFDQMQQRARAAFKVQAKLYTRLDLNRFAIPPTKSSREVEQLELWNKLIRYALSNPCNFDAKQMRQFMIMLYEQCLCVFRYNPEIWLAYGKYVVSSGLAIHQDGEGDSASGGGDIVVASDEHLNTVRDVYRRAIIAVPSSALLRIAYAEMEESYGCLPNAHVILRESYSLLPSGCTFSALQRFLRRTVGQLSARMLFSQTAGDRNDNTKKFGFDIYLANARLELYSNSAADVAVKVLDLCRVAYPVITDSSIAYARLMVNALQRCGNLTRIRALLTTLLGASGSAEIPYFLHSTGETLNLTDSVEDRVNNARDREKNGSGQGTASHGTQHATNAFTLEEQLELWELFLNTENTAGACTIVRLNILRECRDRALASLDEKNRSKAVVGSTAIGAGASGASTTEMSAKIPGLFDVPIQITQMHGVFAEVFPDVDKSCSERSRGRSALGANSKEYQMSHGFGNVESESSVPAALQLLISRLPPHVGPELDIDMYLRQFKTVTLPPRPLVESVDGADAASSFGAGAKRALPAGAEWLSGSSGTQGQGGAGMDGDDIDYEANDSHQTSRDDVFRARQRARRS